MDYDNMVEESAMLLAYRSRVNFHVNPPFVSSAILNENPDSQTILRVQNLSPEMNTDLEDVVVPDKSNTTPRNKPGKNEQIWDHYNRIRVNKVIPPVVYGGFKNKNEDNIYICLCKEVDPDPCGITSNCLNRNLQIECQPKHCHAGVKCQNQMIRRKVYPKLRVFRTLDRGCGLMTLEDLKAGDFIIEYVGEVITVEERNVRMAIQSSLGINTFYYCDLSDQRVIDAGPSGNLARFINHSCDPNGTAKKWNVDGETRIAIHAVKDIKAGNEIFFDYKCDANSGTLISQCLCRAKNCRGRIGGSLNVNV